MTVIFTEQFVFLKNNNEEKMNIKLIFLSPSFRIFDKES